MSIDITISVNYIGQSNSEAFLDLSGRLCARSVKATFRLCEIVSGNWEDNYRDIAPIQSVDEIERVFGQKTRIQVQMGFVLNSGRTVPVTLSYTAKDYNSGYSFRDSGPLSLLVPLSDLATPLLESGGVEVEDALQEPGLTSECIRDAEDLFFAACGVGNDDRSSLYVNHGMMYSDLGFLSPIGCSMVYHHQPSDVLADYPRIYCAYNYGTNSIDSLIQDRNLWQLTPTGAEAKRPGRLDADLYREVFTPNGEHVISFLNNLEKSRLSSLKNQTEQRIREWFGTADLARSQINIYNLPHGSIAMTTYPLFTLWRAYAELYDTLSA